MPSCTTIRNTTLLFLLLGQGTIAAAQATGESPYSAYGFGDILPQGQAVQGLMAGNSLALAEPYALLLGNPASYADLARPLFETGVTFRSTRSSSTLASSTLNEANFTGFQIGVPFGRGKWGLALGLAPFSDVGYSTQHSSAVDGGEVTYKYAGSGGLDRAFLGLARTLFQQPRDTLGNTGLRVTAGANFNFLFGSMEQTRDAVYPANQGYTNIRAFSSLILRAPGADASVVWQGDLTRKQQRGDDNWRWSAGISAKLPVHFTARYKELVTSYVASSGIETIRDTIPGGDEVNGSVEFPLALSLGFGAHNKRWGFSAEIKQRDWSRTKVDVPGYELGIPLHKSTTIGVAASFRPGFEGNVFRRAVYRAGFRHAQAAQEIRGQALATQAAMLGVSLPLNAVQTNSWFTIGAELGQRGTTDMGLIKESYTLVRIGLTFTPWRGERWFTARKIQ